MNLFKSTEEAGAALHEDLKKCSREYLRQALIYQTMMTRVVQVYNLPRAYIAASIQLELEKRELTP